MIGKDEFVNLIESYKKQDDRIHKIGEAGFQIWDTDVIEYGYTLFSDVIDILFDKEGSEFIFWWLYEPKKKIWDKDNNEIQVNTIEEFWEFIKDYRK